MSPTPPLPIPLKEIAARFGGELLGDSGVRITQVAPLETAESPHLSFLAHAKFRRLLAGTRAGALIVGREARDLTTLPRIVCDNPYAYFARVSAWLNPLPAVRPGIDPAAVVHPAARVAATAYIGPLASIGCGVSVAEGASVGAGCILEEGVRVGTGTRLYPRVVVYRDCILGARGIVHSGAVIGADGFGLAPDDGQWLKIPQVGRVVIGDDVEIGANTTIDRGTMGDTIIEDGVKLDNQIQVGHNVRIGAHTAIAGCAGIAGSALIGRHCTIGGSAMILGHLEIADRVHIAAGTLVTKSVRQAGAYAGAYPFEEQRKWQRNAVQLRRLDTLARTVALLERRLEQLERTRG